MGKFSLLAWAIGMMMTTQVFAQAKPIFPGYGNCPVVDKVVNALCVTDVNNRYLASLAAYNRTVGIVTDRYTATEIPLKPVNSCTKLADGSADNTCENAFLNSTNQYNKDFAAYQALQSQMVETQLAQSAALQARTTSTVVVAPTTGGGVTDTLAEITQKNKDGSAKYSMLQTVFTVASIAAAVKAASCGVSPCAGYFWAASAAAALLASKSGAQAATHDGSAHDSCVAQNALSSTPTNCVPLSGGHIDPNTGVYVPDPLSNPTSTFIGQIDPATGACKASAPASCTTTLTALHEQGVDTRSFGPLANQFAGSKPPFKINPDGTVTRADGKTFKDSDFADEKSMAAAGLSGSEASAISSALKSGSDAIAKAGLDTKGDLKDLAHQDFGTFGSSGGDSGMSVKLGDGTSQSSLLGEKDGLLNGKNRKPSSMDNIGLVRSFNGDSIGIANDDIFKMMNKRYKLKSAQDAFIGQ